ncbi:hypothetical protein D018_4899A, partial [Vibrio parahaemolyticus VP2007-007]
MHDLLKSLTHIIKRL